MGGHRTGDARPVQGIDLLRAPCRVPPLRLAQRGHRPAHTAPARVGLQLFGEQRRLAVPAQPLGLEVFALRLTPGHRLHASARLSGERAPSFPNPRFRPERAGLPLAHLGAPRPRTPQSCHSCSSCPLPVLAHTASSRHHLPSAFMSNQRKRNSTGPKAARDGCRQDHERNRCQPDQNIHRCVRRIPAPLRSHQQA